MMKIQPINNDLPANRVESSTKPVLKSRLKRLLDRPFTRISNSEKLLISGDGVVAGTEFEPSLAKMVQNYMEENNDKQTKNGRNTHRCNCFNGNNDISDDELDFFDYDNFKSLIQCGSFVEKSLLVEATKIIEKNKSVKRKDELRKIVVDELSSLGYDSSICKSKWDKTRSIPAGEYEYIDVIVNGERLIIDIDFRSEFEIARQTSGYKELLQSLPLIFVGKSDRIRQIVSIVSEASKQSLKKKGMHFPPWRKADYMRAKWLSSYTRNSGEKKPTVTSAAKVVAEPELDSSEIELIFEEKVLLPPLKSPITSVGRDDDDVAESVKKEAKVVTGLALLFKENH
ncbi:unnamed protein product [Arabidopsis thaliana]|uniref:Uncharacterized protein At4g14620 n=3 Tax=Arabidopsis TaxID=3701 RepID=Q8L7H9_ARATH|nr:hypothetical protein (DUF506) [Arabidopsis thaliana]AAM91628.1 unknown protein [Arabidopsis thaliana]AEE83467.1 hypothetical protein (DUF506) [Arabidopsis thaliana]KAG7620465.1 PDDEXK-like [Arabidopsis suecica]VYS62682.1 unnamed protein product [Arabidopsis thaliana]|eukprot:NP_193198.2 hypothetical protein (DUF506) [Arabidopsis thaliana]